MDLPTLFDSPTSLPHHIEAAATTPEKVVITKAGPIIVGRIEARNTNTSGSQDILENYYAVSYCISVRNSTAHSRFVILYILH